MPSNPFRILLAICVLLTSVAASAHVFDEQGVLGDTKQIKLLPLRSGGNLIGLEVYELWTNEKIGHAVLSKRSYYRFDTQRVTEDRDWYHLTGFLAETALEVENRYETQHWSITPELAAVLDRAARLVANPKSPIDEVKAMYRSLSRSAFTVKASPLEREGKSQSKWLPGLQKIDQVEFTLSRSPKYGNHFVAQFAN